MKAIGATAQQANGALRLSLGYDTTAAEIETAAELIVAAFNRHATEFEAVGHWEI